MDQKEIDALVVKNKELESKNETLTKDQTKTGIDLAASKVELSEAKTINSNIEKKAADDKIKAEKEGVFNKLFAENKVVEAQRVPYMEGDMAKFSELAVETKPGSTGHGDGNSSTKFSGDAEDELIHLAEKKATEKKIPFSEAQNQVLSENPELRKKYESKFAEL